MQSPSPISTLGAVSHDLPDAGNFPVSLRKQIRAYRMAAVITIDETQTAVPLARALHAGGIRVIELAWRTAATCSALRLITEEFPGMLIGLGTLLSASQVQAAKACGAAFGVSPGISGEVVASAQDCGLPFAPGVQTPSDLQLAVERGCRFVKYFPAESAGGVGHLRNLHAPLAHLGLEYLALGGINDQNAAAYLAEPCVAAVGGSWIAPAELVRQKAWEQIQARAHSAIRLVSTFKRSDP